MRMGIDLFSLCVVGAAFILSQIRQIPAQLRYFILAAAFAVVAVYRFRRGADKLDFAVVAVAGIFCLMNLVKGMRYRPPPVS
jgi:hypothetical protein